MGNANTHTNERRKSRPSDAYLGGSFDGVPGGHLRRLSGSTPGPPKRANYDEVGPLSIAAPEFNAKVAGLNGAHRPRATTEVGRKVPKQRSQEVQPELGQESPGIPDYEKMENVEGGGKKGLPTIFKFPGNAKEVYVCGTFNDWKRLPMSKSTKDFVAIVDLREGEHEYKFLVDGQWMNDPGSELVERDGFRNNVIRVQKADFNAYDALDMDSEAVAKLSAKTKFPDCYGQEAPSANVFEHRSGPPILPPHLLQVILNKDTPLSCEPTLLPEPNHVMINHLYALSIKDGVMVLSSTQRYRKKYVTTLLYKPMGSRKGA